MSLNLHGRRREGETEHYKTQEVPPTSGEERGQVNTNLGLWQLGGNDLKLFQARGEVKMHSLGIHK